MSKPVQISEREFNKIYDALRKKAFEYSVNNNGDFWNYLSTSDVTCAYNYDKNIPKSFRGYGKEDVIALYHFLPKECKSVKMSCQIEAICLCKTDDEEYFLDSHRVGRCSWKITEEEHNLTF